MVLIIKIKYYKDFYIRNFLVDYPKCLRKISTKDFLSYFNLIDALQILLVTELISQQCFVCRYANNRCNIDIKNIFGVGFRKPTMCMYCGSRCGSIYLSLFTQTYTLCICTYTHTYAHIKIIQKKMVFRCSIKSVCYFSSSSLFLISFNY